MPTFDTPEPVAATAHVEAGSIRFVATDRADTVVEVRPRAPGRDLDVRAAEQTEVTHASGVLLVRTPRPRYRVGRTGTVDVTVELPTGSRVEVTGAWLQVFGEGRLGEVRGKTSLGDTRLETSGPLHLTAAHGSVAVDRIEGDAEITTSSGSLRVGLIDGRATLKNSHGTTTLAAVTGELRVNSTTGGVDIGRAEDSVTATTTHGSLRIGEVVRGTVELGTAHGAIEVGVREGTAAWLDASSAVGQVRNTLAATDSPAGAEETVSIRARSRVGTIHILRARP
ncbi:Putative adhesin [Streptomyces zhaozhouensis]|uniref:Adhesin n=1 Tax=Streptomyces zhaozhouensis TaxID=1300267 RepID=A0A286E076_9ACTN|nr:DUF4097 family beta strand repeat-containing protein [Streptomyces zhaozhouensis]SOD64307.1 Putative adhesin [Streptomyces zhaozhouensis]